MLQRALKPAEEARDPLAGWSLPGWLYHDPGFFALEVERVLRPAAQIVCHLSDIEEPGAWRAFDYLGERLVVVRQRDGSVRAFANVCRHRGSRIADGEAAAAAASRCPYHAGLRSRRQPRRHADARGYEGSSRIGSACRFEAEIWRSFVFVTRAAAGPTSPRLGPHYGDRALSLQRRCGRSGA